MPKRPPTGRAQGLGGDGLRFAGLPTGAKPSRDDQGSHSEQTYDTALARFARRVVIPALTERWLRQYRPPRNRPHGEKEVACPLPPALP